MNSKGALPRKVAGLHEQDLGGEFVVVDESTQRAHALTGASAELWRSLGSGAWPDATDAELDAAVTELVTLGLVEQAGMTRRLLLQRAGTVAVAGTVISISLPTMHAAASHPALNPGVVNVSGPTNVNAGSPFNLTASVVQVTGHAVPTGTVSLYTRVGSTDTLVESKALVAGSATFTVTQAAGTTTYVVKYSGDAQYATGESTPKAVVAVGVQPVKTNPSIAIGSFNLAKNTGFQNVVVTVTGTNGVAPTGNVTLSSVGATIANGTVALVPGANGTSTATFSVDTPNGNSQVFTLTASYPGDTNYNAATTGAQTYTTSA